MDLLSRGAETLAGLRTSQKVMWNKEVLVAGVGGVLPAFLGPFGDHLDLLSAGAGLLLGQKPHRPQMTLFL